LKGVGEESKSRSRRKKRTFLDVGAPLTSIESVYKVQRKTQRANVVFLYIKARKAAEASGGDLG